MINVEQFKKITQELSELYEAKDKAYGSSFSDTYKKLGIISAVTRISDKFNRMCNLATNPGIDNLGESLEDTLRDMASYCIMTVMELENAKPIGLDMQGNILKRGDISYKCSIEIPEDAPVLAMLREEDRKIHKGDKFECVKNNVAGEDDKIIFTRGKTYISESDGCVTDNTRTQTDWSKFDWWHYFKRI